MLMQIEILQKMFLALEMLVFENINQSHCKVERLSKVAKESSFSSYFFS